MDRHPGDIWLIHGSEPRKDNKSQNPKKSKPRLNVSRSNINTLPVQTFILGLSCNILSVYIDLKKLRNHLDI